MRAKMDSKVCGVCGDRALGFNFNAVTCESCKAFFRRNALVQKEFKCVFNGQCSITKITRRFCQKCRLDKCFSIGMRKDLIMSEEDKVAKRQKIEENRAKRRIYNGFKSGFKKIKRESVEPDSPANNELFNSLCSTDSDSREGRLTDDSFNERLVTSSDDVRGVQARREEEEEEEASRLPSLLAVGHGGDSRCSHAGVIADEPEGGSERANIVAFAQDVVNDVRRIQSIAPSSNSIESILCEAIKLEYEAFSSIAQFNSNSRELNDAERAKLNELIVANKALLTPIDDELNGLNTLIGDENRFKEAPEKQEADPVLLGVINLTAICIRRLIKMAKKINAFKNMCQEDQVALLKGGCTEIMLLRSAMNYDPKLRTWQIPHSIDTLNVNVEILKLAKGNIYQVHEHFIRTFDPKWQSDENIILILCAVVLFTPDRQRVVHQDVIKLEQNSYYYLLRRYLESVYPGCEAKSTFLKLIQKISEVRKVNEELINVYLNVNPAQVEPLLIEIFDLKHK